MRFDQAWATVVWTVVVTAVASAQPPAFPGAEGFGAAAVGGRGGRVIHVTNLSDDGPGSFRAALAEKGPRIIVFDVGGTIELKRDLAIPRGHGHVTIAGQTAPGGVTLVGAQLWLAAYGKGAATTDIVMRHMRVRGLHHVNRPGQGGDCLDLYRTERVIVDHCSFTGAADETIDTSGSTDFTIQWCTIEESCLAGQGGAQHDEDSHNLGIIISYHKQARVSLHHNVFAHHKYRMPAVYQGAVCDFRNNVIYNWRSHAGTFQASIGSNIVGNTYVQGVNTRGKNHQMFYRKQGAGIFFRDNAILPTYPPPVEPMTLIKLCKGHEEITLFDAPVQAAPVTTQPCGEAYGLVLDRAGAWPRDTTTRRTVHEVRTRTGEWGLSGPFEYFAEREDGPTSATRDRDRDGMSDAWERANGLDPADASDGSKIVPRGVPAGEARREHVVPSSFLPTHTSSPDCVT